MASPGSVVIQFVAKADKARKDVVDFAKSLGKVETEADSLDSSLDALETELDDIGRAAADLKTDMEKAEVGFDGVGDEAERTADRLRTEANKMASAVRGGADGIDRETSHMKADLADTGKEAGSEFIGNVAEGIGSGQTNLNDIVSGTLGGITNLASSLTGPLALAAAGAAGGIGLVFSAIKGEAEKAKQRIDAIRTALEGVDDQASETAENAIFAQWIEDAQEVPGKIERINDVLKTSGVTAEEFQAALAGDPGAIDIVRTKVQKVGGEYIKIQTSGKKLTAEQQAYLDNFPEILQEVHAQDEAVGAVRREQKAIKELTGDTTDESKRWREELDDIYARAKDVSGEVDGIAGSHAVNFIVTTKDKNGRPVHLGPASLAVPSSVGVAALAAPPTVNVTVAAPPNIMVTEEQVYRAIQRLIVRGDARNGRRVIIG